MKFFYLTLMLAGIAGYPIAQAQQAMPGMKMPMNSDPLMQQMHPDTFLQQILHHATSGTSAEPNSTPAPMLMEMKGPWMLMFHANAFVLDLQQTSPRGGDKAFSTNWFMPMAERDVGRGQLTLRPMFSLGRRSEGHGSDDRGPALPAAFPAGRNGLRQADCRWPASA